MATSRDHHIERTEQRRTAARARARRQQQIAMAVVAVVVVVLILVALTARGPALRKPAIVLNWPHPAVRQVVASGESFVVPAEAPLHITLEGTKGWTCTWRDGSATATGPAFDWASSNDVTITCNETVSGVRRFMPWTHQAHTFKLKAAKVEDVGNGRVKLSPAVPQAWIFPLMLARQGSMWDKRAPTLLLQALPARAAASPGSVDAARWVLMEGFQGDRARGDVATYGHLNDSEPQRSLTHVARVLSRQAPKSSIKFIVRLDGRPPYGVLRLVFDGKAERAAWIKKEGEAAGAPYEWWEGPSSDSRVAPTIPPSLATVIIDTPVPVATAAASTKPPVPTEPRRKPSPAPVAEATVKPTATRAPKPTATPTKVPRATPARTKPARVKPVKPRPTKTPRDNAY